MSEMEHLQQLSNAALRKKCVKNGIDAAVTDSTRSVLIRKLAAISGESSEGKKVKSPEAKHRARSTSSRKLNRTTSVIESGERAPLRRSKRLSLAMQMNKPGEDENAKEEESTSPIARRTRSSLRKTLSGTEEAATQETPITKRRRSSSQKSEAQKTPAKSIAKKIQAAIPEEVGAPRRSQQLGEGKSVGCEADSASVSKKYPTSLEFGSEDILDKQAYSGEDLITDSPKEASYTRRVATRYHMFWIPIIAAILLIILAKFFF